MDCDDTKSLRSTSHAITARRLRPTIDSERFSNLARPASRIMRIDGNHIGLLLKMRNLLDGHLLTIWNVDEDLDFWKRMQAESWARILFRRRLDPMWLNWDSQSIAFRDDGYCGTQIDSIHISSGTVQLHTENPLEWKLLGSMLLTGALWTKSAPRTKA